MSASGEFYVIASESMRPVEAIGPLRDRKAAAAVVAFLQLTKLRFPLSIATRRPTGIPIMPAERFVVEVEAARARARAEKIARAAAGGEDE